MVITRLKTPLLRLCLVVASLALGVLSTNTGERLAAESAAPAATSLSVLASRDAWLNADAVTTTYGRDDDLWIGIFTYSGKMDERRLLVWFDIAALPANAIVDSALLEMMQTRASGAGSYAIWPYQVTGAWGEYTVTWENQPGAISAGDPPATVNAVNGVKTWDITRIVQAWQAGAPNHGILLLGDGTTVGARVYASRESQYAPGRLTVYYHLPGSDTPRPTATTTRTPTPTGTTTRTPTPTGTATRTPTPTGTATGTPVNPETPAPTPSGTPTVIPPTWLRVFLPLTLR
jgi:cell division septation protein DedD